MLQSHSAPAEPLPLPTDVGILGVYQLKRAWARALAARNGRPFPADQQDFHFDHLVIDALGSQPIAGRAGDLVIWNDALPHGSRPNRGSRPRIVQYIKMYPTRMAAHEVWK